MSTGKYEGFRSQIGLNVFKGKYKHEGCETWPQLSYVLINQVCGGLMPQSEIDELVKMMTEFKFLPGGRYIYYAGRPISFFNNCFLLKAEYDTREEWAEYAKRVTSCLMTGGGIGGDFSLIRPKNAKLKRTGGVSSGPVSLMHMQNEIGRVTKQGGGRRSAIWAGLLHSHPDIWDFLKAKNWNDMFIGDTGMSIGMLKEKDFNYPAPLDCTNISVLYDDEWLHNYKSTGELGDVFMANVRQALSTGEPGFAFNFGEYSNETLRNACTEVTSEDDSDVCNLGSINMANVESIEEFEKLVHLVTKFLICGTLKADLPYEKVAKVREKNRRLGLGLMGMHEWLICRGSKYEVTHEMHEWLQVYRDESDRTADEFCSKLDISKPVAKRAIAPTGSIAILAGTTSGIEPIYAVSYTRRYLVGDVWNKEFCIEAPAKYMIEERGVDPKSIETADDLAKDWERRIKFQYDVQRYVDQAISSTINLPSWGSDVNNESKVEDFAHTLARYAEGLRGFTCYPDGARGGQPLEAIPYDVAVKMEGQIIKENFTDMCSIFNKSSCG